MRREIGPYQVGRPIGHSAMGLLHAGHDLEHDRPVLVAVAHEPGSETGHTRRMRREALTLMELCHPNLVAVLDVGVLDGRLYVILEHVAGTAIDRHAREHRLPWPRVLELFAAAGRGLAAVHGRAVVHGALTAACMRVARVAHDDDHDDDHDEDEDEDEDERVRVCDFALARPSRPEPLLWPAPATPASAESAPDPVVEDASGRAPELAAGAPPTIYSDQFAFATALARALDSAPRSRWRGLPRRLRRALDRARAVAPGERYASMYELLHELTRR